MFKRKKNINKFYKKKDLKIEENPMIQKIKLFTHFFSAEKYFTFSGLFHNYCYLNKILKKRYIYYAIDDNKIFLTFNNGKSEQTKIINSKHFYIRFGFDNDDYDKIFGLIKAQNKNLVYKDKKEQ